ncbi:MAG: acyl-CoA thioesterase [Deltaproteobacteria bacterium]|nr:acyl-CoA thioesterase [Deltaproteobacteria bacterium]
MNDLLQGKTFEESMVETTELIQPNDGNHLGNVFGGKVLSMIDLTGAMAAMRHCRTIVVTASMDRVDFRHPIRIGTLAIVKARLNGAFRTSVEVGVDIFSENPLTGARCKTCTALVTYVALDGKGRPTPVPPLVCRTVEEEALQRKAEERKRLRDAERPRESCPDGF